MNDTPLFARRPSTFCQFADCTERASYHDVPICRAHAATIWKAFEAVEPQSYKQHILADAKDLAAGQKAVKAAETRKKVDNRRRPGTIYYLRIGDRIKIGYTIDLYQRMMQYPPNSELLATHPGTPMTERDMHSRFAKHLADGREWFHPNQHLDAHIEDVQKRFPLTTSIAKMRAAEAVKDVTVRPKANMARRVR